MENSNHENKKSLMRDIFLKSRLSLSEKENLKEKEAEEYLAISESDKHPLVKKYHKSKHILKWAIKLLVPDFLIGHPSLWDNLKTLKKHPEFKPFRMAITAWIIFSLTIGSAGIYSLMNAPTSKASGLTQITKDTDVDFNQGILNSTIISGTGPSTTVKLSGNFGPDNTSYYKSVTIDNSAGGALSNFPVLITVDTATLISVGKLQSNCADIRFTDFDKTTPLSYYLASGCNTTTTSIWVKVPTINVTSFKTIYFFYNSSSATDQSNFNNTFTLPSTISGNLLWLKADALTASDGGLISSWTDSSGNSSNAIAPSGKEATYKTNIINGKPVIRFNGINNFYNTTLTSTFKLNNYSIFAVHRPIGSTYGMLFASDTPSDDELIDMNYPTSGLISTYHAGQNVVGATYPFISGTPLISEFISATSTGTPYYNGLIKTAGTPATRTSGTLWRVGAYQSSGGYWYTGDMAEIILYNSAISDLNRRLVEAYLSAKYGISISGTLSTAFGIETGVIAAAGTWESSNNSNIIDLGYNLGWGDGTNGNSVAFSANFSNVSNNSTLTFYMRVANMIASLPSASYINLGTVNSGTSFTKTKTDLDSLGLGINENRYAQVKVVFSQTGNNNPSLDSFYIAYMFDNPPGTPTNSSPESGALKQDPNLILSASPFSDIDPGSSQSAAEWQVRNLSDATYSSPVYDSGIDITDLTSITIPPSTLELNTTYFWKVRYKDELGAWSPYSPETAFTVGVTPITVVSVGATEYQSGETAKLTVQVQDADGTPVNSATTKITIYNPSNSAVVSDGVMTYLAGSSGLYYYDYLIPASVGVYTYQVNAEYNGNNSYSSHAFHISPALNTITTLNTNLNTVNTNLNTTNSNLNTANNTLNTVNNNVNTANTNISTINTNVNNTKDTLSTVNTKVDTVTTKVDSTNTKVDAVDTKVTSANTKLDTANSSLSSLTSNLDVLLGAFIVTQSSINDTSPLATSFVTSLLNTTNNFYKNSVLTFTGGDLKGQSRRILAYDGTTKKITLDPALSLVPANGDTFTIVAQNVRVEEVANNIATTTADTNTKVTDIQTKVSDIQTKVNAISTKLDTVDINLDTLGTNIEAIRVSLQSNSPAQVLINSMTSLTVPTISANVTITNEGNSAYEYQYNWCVVNGQDKPCTDSIAHATAAKLIQAGDSFNPTLSLTVPNSGDYWFKLFVTFGSQTSVATRSFTAVPTTNTNSISGGGGVSYSIPTPPTMANISSSSLDDMRNQLQLNALSLNKILGILGNVDPKTSGFKSLLAINEENTNSVKDVQNKIADLKAISATIHQLADQKSTEPIVQTYMQFNSVELHFLITNPDTKEQTVHFKAFLPEEVKPENIMNANGLKVDFDTNANTYFVSGDITLGKKESIVKKVEMKDIWIFDEVELNLIKQQAIDIVKTLSGTQFESQGIILKGDIETTINMILSKQKDSYSSPQDHIVIYRENKDRVVKVQSEFDQLKNIVAQYNSSKSIVGNIGGIQTFTTYGIILAIIFGFGLLAAVIFAMWRHQTNLTIQAMGMRRKKDGYQEYEEDEHINGKRKI